MLTRLFLILLFFQFIPFLPPPSPFFRVEMKSYIGEMLNGERYKL